MTVLSKGYVGGDFIIREHVDPYYCRGELPIDNSAGTDVLEVPAGFPLEADGTLATATNESDIVALVLQPQRIPAGETVKVAVLLRGPCVINRDALPTADLAGTPANFDMDDFQTALEALDPPLVVKREPVTQETQTT